jgi:hypothetical protein
MESRERLVRRRMAGQTRLPEKFDWKSHPKPAPYASFLIKPE